MKAANGTRRCGLPLPWQIALAAMAVLAIADRGHGQALLSSSTAAQLPDAPSVVFVHLAADDSVRREIVILPPCPPAATSPEAAAASASGASSPVAPCLDAHPLRIVVDSEQRQPLTSGQKGLLAVRSFVDPANLAVNAAEAAIVVSANSHSAYGPGMRGFGRLTGYNLLEDAQGSFLGVYLIPSLVHEDPRYRRMQNASVKRRVFHALSRTVIAEHDDGRPMLNYATLLTYPICAELTNLYVPGLQTDGPATFRRIGIGLATDPASNLIAEFLPDIARRIHVKSIFVRQIVNQMAVGQGGAQ